MTSVFKTGETELGVIEVPEDTAVFISKTSLVGTVCPLITTVNPTPVLLASTVVSNVSVKQTSSVPEDLFGWQFVARVLPKLTEIVLLVRSQGRLVPVIVTLSAPIRFIDVVGVTVVMVQVTVSLTTVEPLGITPRL